MRKNATKVCLEVEQPCHYRACLIAGAGKCVRKNPNMARIIKRVGREPSPGPTIKQRGKRK
jgi:hypothetical protein